MEQDKRKISILIPFRRNGGRSEVFLQKRAKDAERLPDYFGFFGGGLEGNETHEQALVREIAEELSLELTGYEFFGEYEIPVAITHAYFIEVADDFEAQIRIGEGEYGKFFTEEELKTVSKMCNLDRAILKDFFAKF